MFISKSKFLTTAKRVFRSFGIEVSFASGSATEQNILRSVFRAHDFNFIIDVGANFGQYGSLVRSCGFRGTIVSFEPLTAAHSKLATRAASDRHWIVADRCALGSGPSRATVNVAANLASSSLLGMHPRHIIAAPHSAYAGTEEVAVVALDDCIDKYVTAAKGGLLKIDTQGYEMEVLRGSCRTLSEKLDAVQVELSLVELYEGQPMMLDICNFLRQFGFNLRHIIPGFKNPINGSLLQLDGVFTRD